MHHLLLHILEYMFVCSCSFVSINGVQSKLILSPKLSISCWTTSLWLQPTFSICTSFWPMQLTHSFTSCLSKLCEGMKNSLHILSPQSFTKFVVSCAYHDLFLVSHITLSTYFLRKLDFYIFNLKTPFKMCINETKMHFNSLKMLSKLHG